MSYYLAPSLVRLRDEVNARWPNRDKGSDGWIGDPAHASRVSDHNPDPNGMVHAIDVDVDGIDVPTLLNAVIGDERVWYVIYNRVIYSRTYDWAARVYTGSNPHVAHVHISLRYTGTAEQSTQTWLAPQKRRTTGGRLPTVDLSNLNAQVRKPTKSLFAVKAVQHALNIKTKAGLKPDGWWGPNTRQAYKRYEQLIRAPRPDGVPGKPSLTQLGCGRFRVRG